MKHFLISCSAIISWTVTFGQTSTEPNLTAIDSNNSVVLRWTIDSGSKASYIDVERSNDGTDYRLLSRVSIMINNANLPYSYIDKAPYRGYNFYRLKLVNREDDFSYSPAARVETSYGFDVNLAVEQGRNYINIMIVGPDNNEKLHLEVLDQHGRLLYQEEMTFTGPVYARRIAKIKVERGFYFYEVTRLLTGQSMRGQFAVK